MPRRRRARAGRHRSRLDVVPDPPPDPQTAEPAQVSEHALYDTTLRAQPCATLGPLGGRSPASPRVPGRGDGARRGRNRCHRPRRSVETGADRAFPHLAERLREWDELGDIIATSPELLLRRSCCRTDTTVTAAPNHPREWRSEKARRCSASRPSFPPVRSAEASGRGTTHERAGKHQRRSSAPGSSSGARPGSR